MMLIYLGVGVFSLYLTMSLPAGDLKRLGYLSAILMLATCYKGQLFIRFFLPFLFQIISIMIEQSYSALLQPVREILLLYGTYGKYCYYLLGILLSNFTIFLLIKLFSFKKEYILLNQNTLRFPIYALLLLIFPQGISYSINCLSNLMSASHNAQVNFAATIAIVILTLFTIAYFFLFGFILQYQQKKQENSILQKQVEQERHYHQILLERHQLFQGLRHDMKQQFDTIANLLAGQHTQEALAIAENQSGKLTMTAVIQSGHPLVDTILTLKEDQARQLGAQFKCYVSAAIEVGNIAADDLASLLGNILDNAIEAITAIPQIENRKIRCQIVQDIHYLYIMVSNTVAEDIEIVNDHIHSTKAHRELHGYGLLNVKNIVRKYRGRCHFKCANKVFTVKIILPVTMEEAQ